MVHISIKNRKVTIVKYLYIKYKLQQEELWLDSVTERPI